MLDGFELMEVVTETRLVNFFFWYDKLILGMVCAIVICFAGEVMR